MDAWKDVVTSDQYAVYLGQWINWSRGPIFGATLTLTQRDGSLVIAFAAFFVTLVASRVWRVICISCHQVSSSSKPEDAPYHQLQIILRNSPSPQSALWKLVRLGWGHKGASMRKLGRTIAPVSLALICLAGFAGVTFVLPLLSASVGNEVLLRPGQCGEIDYAALLSNLTEYHELGLPLITNAINNAENYAQQCYSNSSGTLGCTGFIKDRIPSVVQLNAECPFNETVCRNKTSNLFLDTGYIDSHNYMGLNMPVKDRLSYRRTLQCAPLVTKDFTTTWQSSAGNFTRYHHGFLITGKLSNHSLSDGLYMIEDLESQYRTFNAVRHSQYPIPTTNYQIDAFHCKIENKTVSEYSEYVPSPKLRRDDGDSVIIYLSGNGVSFPQPSNDDWYRATKPSMIAGQDNSDSMYQTFIFEEAASPLGCVEQFQFCFEALPRGKQCGPVASLADSATAAAEISPSDTAIALLVWVFERLSGTKIDTVVKILGAGSLASQRNLAIGSQGPIAANQWQLDVVHWWSTSLAYTQSKFIDSVVGPSDRRLDKYITLPENPAICSSQKIRTTAYTSFNVFGLYILFIGGVVLILLSFSIEPIISCLHRRRRYSQYRYLEWVTNESLQLHRLAHEGVGWGTWSRATEEIPTIEKGQVLGCLDLTEPRHPVLFSLPSTDGHRTRQ
ncbi:hypothetical protein F5Y12DRAFT_782402 [Xylaria sp. FL1777]|nr:hypothetical protein F5Y12DRAFT_782402 [Xylaria sp. FL1777]